MKNPIPLLLVILGGAYLMSQAEEEMEEEDDEVPTSIDYKSPLLIDALDKTDEVENE